MDPIGGKRKFKENAFTAKAESGTLKVKILRKDLQGSGFSGGSTSVATGTSLGAFLSATRAKLGQQPARAPEPPRSPPKPRPNRKHVPIFYQLQTHSGSSIDSGGDASQSLSASSDGLGDAASMSTSSSGGRFSTLLSGLQLGDAGSGAGASNGALLRPPPSNPLFTRNDSDGSLFGDLLRHAFPSAQGPAPPLQQQLAASSSSSAFGASLASLSTAARGLSDAGVGGAYRFNPFTALQSAIDVHQATQSASLSGPHAPYHLPHERQQQQRQQQREGDDEELGRQDASMDSEDGDEVGALANDLGPPPPAPPAFAIQNSLMGGGIESQPVIANVNTYNFDWSSRQGRPRSGSLPSVLESAPTSGGSSSVAGSSSSSREPTAGSSAGSMWKEV
ncbi:hypothetical protein PybrP1_012854 [[Pythium] brassicae (nom. inval.)]|nr:hypothetical protein PybrP1_012854 [[Pythium] brassicae (nom. inval.)]